MNNHRHQMYDTIEPPKEKKIKFKCKLRIWKTNTNCRENGHNHKKKLNAHKEKDLLNKMALYKTMDAAKTLIIGGTKTKTCPQ